jgi:hypothetical protein
MVFGGAGALAKRPEFGTIQAMTPDSSNTRSQSREGEPTGQFGTALVWIIGALVFLTVVAAALVVIMLNSARGT